MNILISAETMMVITKKKNGKKIIENPVAACYGESVMSY